VGAGRAPHPQGPEPEDRRSLLLFEVITQPGAGPPPHVQHREDEAFYVLEGEYEFLVDGHTLRAWAGSLVYVPKGTLHAHANVGKVPGRMLTTHTPGDLYELFFENAGRPAEVDADEPPAFGGRPRVEERIVEVASEFGIEIPPPCRRSGPMPVGRASPREQPVNAYLLD
jgi:quercetin dioxygenase-like cupin family protein